MNLTRILQNIEVKDKINMNDIDITNISSDSRYIKENGLFFAINGYNKNGTDFIDSAIKNGATAIVVEENVDLQQLNISKNIPLISVSKIREALALVSCNLYDNPSKKLKVIGVTGTKGKTTSTFMIKSILEAHGLKVGLIGSIAIYIGDKQLEITDRTTPESYKIQESLNKMVRENVDVAILEVSSQAMKLNRVTGCDFDIALFTNLTEDHISPREHADMDDYFNAKLELMKLTPNLVVNLDNDYTEKIPTLLPSKHITTFGMQTKKYDISAKDLKPENSCVNFTLSINEKDEPICVSIPGEYMVYNALGAIAVATHFDVTPDEIRTALKSVRVFGRSELVPNRLGLTIMIDYAHTPSSLESILKTVKPYTKGRVICTWGVGGDRDKAKRPIMGEISGNLADFTILTSDQVRTEDPMSILKDIEVGLQKSGGKYILILNRTEAIRYALSIATKDDIIVLPGLGNDLYIEYMGVKYPYDERIIIHDIIEEMLDDNYDYEKVKNFNNETFETPSNKI
ncbi:MAG: UDP-N-acetylmuramoyl-L-alanyl-D-glutamate--2,6-diaminopimelate ligase [Clostridia bacterium]|nr:UDP-N-acetylmuramoyl-L-alanyl-D-glutamate--2,6-diaminopimelate ligase [Clostridia bacterium]